jgi:flap endonuclease-1|tara:strand:+ start:26 stop:1057 length:1032 start_codon:yes stop_codon:yes gene_type:complete
MGVAITELLLRNEIEINELKGKIIAIDGHLFLYQFITTIRSRDGSLLTDSKGNITSHLVGLFSRTANLMQNEIKLAFVFDGKPPELKRKVHEQRNNLKFEAEKKFLEAKSKGDKEEMKKYAARTSRLSKDMIEEAKKLISYLGLPIVEAPSEGEAQAAYMVKSGKAFAVASQDADSLIFGAPKLLRNLSVSGRRKKGKTAAYETVKPEIIDLSQNLNNLSIDQNQLITLAMIIGTDYNPGGIKGIGPKNALKLIKQHKSDFNALFKEIKWNEHFDFSWEEVYYLIKKMPTTDDYNLEWKDIDNEKLHKLLVDEHDFSEQRVSNTLEKLKKATTQKQQKSLGDF